MLTTTEIVVLILIAVGLVACLGVARAERKHRQAMKTLAELRRDAWADAARKQR